MCPRINYSQDWTVNLKIKALLQKLAYLTVFCTALSSSYSSAIAAAAAVRCGDNELGFTTTKHTLVRLAAPPSPSALPRVLRRLY